jgi:hypothetical protein
MHNKWYKFQFVIAINPILIFDNNAQWSPTDWTYPSWKITENNYYVVPHMTIPGSNNSHTALSHRQRSDIWQLSCLLHIALHFVNVARRGCWCLIFLLTKSQLFWTGFKSDTPTFYFQRSPSSSKSQMYSSSCQA